MVYRPTAKELLRRKWGENWSVVLRDTMNTNGGMTNSMTSTISTAAGLSPKTITLLSRELGMETQRVHLLPGDELLIRRDGVETIIADRTDAQ